MSNKMDELKHKFLGLINKQPPKIPSMGFNDANYHFSDVPTLSINSKTVQEVDRPADQDILEGIEAAYFSINPEFDICRFELEISVYPAKHSFLFQICFHFDKERYRKLQAAYDLLEKSQVSMIDNLHVHYITAIYNSSFNVIQSYISSPDILDSSENSGKNPYTVLCQAINQDVFIPCLIQLCKVLFKIVLSYHKLVKWHNSDHDLEYAECENDIMASKQKLNHNVTKIWDDVQRKVSGLLLNGDLARYKFDQFVQVLRVVHRLIQVGEEFCSSKSEDLQESIKKQSENYFLNYHAQRLEELKIFLENEMWEICPVKSSFYIMQLQEFKPFRYSMKTFKFNPQTSPTTMNYSTNSTECSSTHSLDGSSIIGNYFIRFAEHGTPFDSGLDEIVIDEDIMVTENDGSGYYSEESDDNDDLENEYVEELNNLRHVNSKERKDKTQPNNPVLTNTSLTVLRQMGKYIQMSRLLKPIAFRIISCMNQLFDYYLYSVHLFFTADLVVSSTNLYSQELNMTLQRISNDLILENVIIDEENQGRDGRVCKPSISPMTELKNPEKLNGLAERIVAVESLVFLSKQFEFLQEYLDYLVPQNFKGVLQQFFLQTIASAPDLRNPVYMAVVAQAFDLRQILTSMSKINWEVRDVRSMHNSYVDTLLREVQIFTLRLEEIAIKVPISTEAYHNIWRNVAHIVTHTLVQGFSEAKKCTNGGRALMQLDFTQFLTKFEKISSLKPVPHKEYVENYVKAYYLPDIELEKWIRDHKEYSSKHMLGLVSCACQNNKKTRQKLLQVIEDIEKNKFPR
uniref:Syndetin n=1 Tax=Diabrotica virgifera virgifera TaxID=50390 RepID=A0A6P7FA09_DIAVI